MHEQSIIDRIINNLDKTNCEIKTISLICDDKELRERLSKDIASGKRKPDIIDRSLVRIPLYHQLNTLKINTNGKTVSEIAEEIARI